MSDLALKMGENGEVLIPMKLKESTRVIKLTKSKQQKFLQFFAHTPNLTKAAAHIKVSRLAIYHAIESNPNFAQAFNQLKEAINDDVREVIITMAIQPSRESYNHTKLYAEANIPEYKRNPDTIVAIQVNTTEAVGELHGMLNKIPITSKK
jgi:hypothetical protein